MFIHIIAVLDGLTMVIAEVFLCFLSGRAQCHSVVGVVSFGLGSGADAPLGV